MTTPTTAAGRALFTDMDPMDMLESNGVTPEDIAKPRPALLRWTRRGRR